MWNLMQSDLIILHHGCGTAEYHMRLFSIFQSILPFGYLILLFSFLLNSTINKNKNATFLPQRYLILSRMLVISSGGTLDILVFPTHSQKKRATILSASKFEENETAKQAFLWKHHKQLAHPHNSIQFIQSDNSTFRTSTAYTDRHTTHRQSRCH